MKHLTAPWMIRLADTRGILPRVVEITLLIVLTLGTWLSVKPWLRPKANSSPVVVLPAAAPIHAPVDAMIATMHIFGSTAVPENLGSDTAESADVSVIGILAADDENISLAVLSVDGASKNYSIGESLPDGELVTHIEPTAVVLKGAGGERRVEMDIKFADSNATFHKAGLTGDDKNSWADAYLDGSAGNPVAAAPHRGIISVPAAAVSPTNKALSLADIRRARALRFKTLMANSSPSTTANPPRTPKN